MAIFYLMYGAGSLFATPVMHRVGPQICMILGSAFDCIWILASIIPAMKMKYEYDKR